MQQTYQCPRCGVLVTFGIKFCNNCGIQLNWSMQPQYQPPPQYQQWYQQQPKPPKKKSNKLGIILLVLGTILLASIGSCVVCVMLPSTSESPLPSLLSDTEFQIKVSGTANLPFSGSYIVVSSSGQSISKSVDGTVPNQYFVEGMIVSMTFQKQTEDGTLKVEILRDGKVVNSSYTTAAYGLVSVATD